MGYRGRTGKTLIRTAVAVLCLGGWLSAQAAVKVWNDGAGATTNWSSGGAGGNWTGAAAPVGGDSLVFAGTLGLTNNNNIAAGTSFAGITFSNNAGAFLLAGNAITLTGSVTNNSTSTETINLAISLSTTINLNAASGNLTLGGVLSGTGGLTLPGNNVVTLNGASANTYGGMTTVNAGELDLAKTAGTAAIGGGLTVGGGTVKLVNANQINDTASVTINSGTFNLNGNSETIDALGGTGGTIINNGAATGTLTVGANNGGSTYSGTITDGASSVALVKAGTGTETLSGNNGYTGGTTVSAGTLKLGNANALGSTTANTTVSSGGALDLNGQTIGAVPLTLSGTGISSGGALVNSSATAASAAGNETGTYSVGGTGAITLTGNVQGLLTKVGGNTLTLGGTVDNAGLGVIANSGTLVLGKTSNGGVHAIGGGSLVVGGATVQLGGSGGDRTTFFEPGFGLVRGRSI